MVVLTEAFDEGELESLQEWKLLIVDLMHLFKCFHHFSLVNKDGIDVIGVN